MVFRHRRFIEILWYVFIYAEVNVLAILGLYFCSQLRELKNCVLCRHCTREPKSGKFIFNEFEMKGGFNVAVEGEYVLRFSTTTTTGHHISFRVAILVSAGRHLSTIGGLGGGRGDGLIHEGMGILG